MAEIHTMQYTAAQRRALADLSNEAPEMEVDQDHEVSGITEQDLFKVLTSIDESLKVIKKNAEYHSRVIKWMGSTVNDHLKEMRAEMLKGDGYPAKTFLQLRHANKFLSMIAGEPLPPYWQHRKDVEDRNQRERNEVIQEYLNE